MLEVKKATQKPRENRGKTKNKTKQGEQLQPTNNNLATPEQRFLAGLLQGQNSEYSSPLSGFITLFFWNKAQFHLQFKKPISLQWKRAYFTSTSTTIEMARLYYL